MYKSLSEKGLTVSWEYIREEVLTSGKRRFTVRCSVSRGRLSVQVHDPHRMLLKLCILVTTEPGKGEHIFFKYPIMPVSCERVSTHREMGMIRSQLGWMPQGRFSKRSLR